MASALKAVFRGGEHAGQTFLRLDSVRQKMSFSRAKY